MTVREDFTQKVVFRLNNKFDDNMLALVNDAVTIVLNDFEIQNRCTSVAVVDETYIGILKKFIATKRIEGLAETTITRYAEQNEKMLRFIGKPVEKIKTDDLRFYLSYKRELGNVSNRTLDGMRKTYSSFFSWCYSEGIIPKNPCASMKEIKYRKTKKMPFAPTDLAKLRDSCENIRDLALVEFLYSTGCRVTEVSSLDIDDVDFDNQECKVIGKGNKERIVYLDDVTAMHLKEYIGTRKDNYDALFVGKGTDRLHKAGIEKVLRELGKRAGVTNVHPHRFRRTLATNLLDRGMAIQDVAEILGHSDISTTMIYCYVSKQNTKNSYKKYI